MTEVNRLEGRLSHLVRHYADQIANENSPLQKLGESEEEKVSNEDLMELFMLATVTYNSSITCIEEVRRALVKRGIMPVLSGCKADGVDISHTVRMPNAER